MAYLRKQHAKVKKENLIFMESLLLFDLWLMMKIRWVSKHVVRVLYPLIKIVATISIGVFITMFMKNESNVAQITDQNSISNSFAKSSDQSKVSAEMCNNFIYQYSKDRILPDFASEASGALVIGTPDTETYNEPNSLKLTVFGMPVWKAGYYTPRKVIQPWTEAGECWAFQGSHGKIEIELAYEIIIEKVTLEHIPADAALTNKIDSAPKHFNVMGKIDGEYVVIGTFFYNNKGLFSQTFEITKTEMKIIPFKVVMLEILSNYGHPNYTCIYRFRVHGKISSLLEE